jgi:hypothetical protein
MFESPVRYNGFSLNDGAPLVGSTGVRRGCVLEVFDYSRAQGVGYTEKRAQDDGLDATDVYMGPRYITLAGTLYGTDEADLQDLLQGLRRALTPTTAYAFDPWDSGYIPLEFSLPTTDGRFALRTDPASTTIRERLVEYRARPTGQPSFQLRRDAGAQPGAHGESFGGMAVQWQGQLECKDPRMYVRPDKWVNFTTPQTALSVVNRGDYPSPLDILLITNSSPAGSYVEVDSGGSTIRLKVGGLAADTIVRYSGELKVLTIDNAAGGEADVLRMDLFVLLASRNHPQVAPDTNAINIRFGPSGGTPTLKTGSRLMFSESFA